MKSSHVITGIGLAIIFGAIVLLLSIVFIEDGEYCLTQRFRLSQRCVWFAGMVMLGFIVGGRKSLELYPRIVAWSLMFVGGIEAVWGLLQIYGNVRSNHALFSLTGSFYNPGPYSGYLAVILPVALHEHLCIRRALPLYKNWSRCLAQSAYYISLIIVLLICCVLPAGMSRSAWLAAAASCLLVASIDGSWHTKNKIFHGHFPHRYRWIMMITIFVLVGVMAGVYCLKKSSADGRLFMWKISLAAIAEKPFSGYGHGGFPAAYGAAQEAYFSRGNYSFWEERVAGSPENAFNEYLQIAIEYGIFALMGLLTVLVAIFYHGIQKRRVGFCAALLSLAIFAFSSYPMQIPAFWVLLLLIVSACLMNNKAVGMMFFVSLVCLGGCLLWPKAQTMYVAKSSRESDKILYQTGAYQAAAKGYEEDYPIWHHQPDFLFEYGHTLHKLQCYEESTQILQEAVKLSCDPMILNIIGKNYQGMKQYDTAETYFIRSTHLLPNRIYPYYLLVELYAEPDYYHPDKLQQAAGYVMTKEPKVHSTAIDEMRRNVEEILELVK